MTTIEKLKQAHLEALKSELKSASLFATDEKYQHMILFCLRKAQYHWKQFNSENPKHYEKPDYSEDDNY